MARVSWTEFAIEDLRAIHDYISQDSKVYADRFIDKIINRVEQLESQPNSGRIVPEFHLETLRELIEGNYRIIYKVTDQVEIIRIHHSARQLRDL